MGIPIIDTLADTIKLAVLYLHAQAIPIIDTLVDTLSYIAAQSDSIFEPVMQQPKSPWLTWLIFLVMIGIRILIGIWGRKIGKRKGLDSAGFLLGFFLGVIGLIILSVLPPRIETTICVHCQRQIPEDANLCPYCGTPTDSSTEDP